MGIVGSRRPWAWAVGSGLVLLVVYCASLASSGPWDPWETHYGEVARQINLRRDPLDLWWRPGNGGPDARDEGTFWSKPPLAFWLMAGSMRVFGVGLGPNPAEMVNSFWTEIALRLPSMLAGFTAAIALGALAWRQVAPMAGVWVGVVLLTLPQWALVSRQALTDMFFVVPVVLSLCAWVVATQTESRPLRIRGAGWRRFPWDRTHWFFCLVLVLVAVVPLALVHAHLGSGYMAARAQRMGKLDEIHAAFAHLFVYWAVLVVIVARSLRWRESRQAWLAMMYLFAGLAMLGKGLIGPALVGAVIFVHALVVGRLDWLRRSELIWGLLLVAVVAFPWHHAMIAYRGERFVNEWIVLHNLARFGSGEQDQAVGTFVFYLETLGLAALPWVAVVPMAIYSSARRFCESSASVEDDSPGTGSGLVKFALIWAIVAAWTVSYSVTKYYHYLLPVLPPFALLVGIWVHGKLRSGPEAAVPWIGAIVGFGLLGLILRDAIAEPAWLAHLTTYLYVGLWRTGAPDVGRLVWCCLPFAVGLGLLLVRRARPAMAAMLLSAMLCVVYVIDDYLPATSENWSQRSAMRIYFDRRGPADRLVSWWFYYRGETFFSKQDIWVLKQPDRVAIGELIDEFRDKDASLWFITTSEHAGRLPSELPAELRDDLVKHYENFHYVLLELPIP